MKIATIEWSDTKEEAAVKFTKAYEETYEMLRIDALNDAIFDLNMELVKQVEEYLTTPQLRSQMGVDEESYQEYKKLKSTRDRAAREFGNAN